MLFIISTANKNIKHNPSKYREIIRELKRGKNKYPNKLLMEARQLNDPYYVSLALFDLSSDSRYELIKAISIAEEALEYAKKVDRLWRRAELLKILAKKVQSWGESEERKIRLKLLDGILEIILYMPNGKGLSDAIVGCAPYIYHKRFSELLLKAISNKGFELIDAKVVIRQCVKRWKSIEPNLKEIMDTLELVQDPLVHSRLMGYLHLQCKKFKPDSDSFLPLQAGMQTALIMKEEERLDALQYLTGQASTKDELLLIASTLNCFENPYNKARLLATLGGRADKAGLREMALDWFKEGLEVNSTIDIRQNRANIGMNLAYGIGRCGEIKLANRIYSEVLDEFGDDKKMIRKICKSMENLGLELPEAYKIEETDKRESLEAVENEIVGNANHILALYNTYEGGLKPGHFRAIARAAPLCYAFGLDLVLIGFPIDNLDDLVNQVITETNIGRGGGYLRRIVEQSRVLRVPCTNLESQKAWKNLGLLVVTTSHPKKDKKVTMKEAVRLAREKHPLQRLCLIMGLGKRGVPSSLLETVQYHLELTGNNVPLETCTAMGVIVQQLCSAEMN